MELKLELCTKSDTERLEQLYLTAFPKDERAPYKMLKNRHDKGKAEFLAAKDGNELVGMVYMVCNDTLAYIFYLAIRDDKRGMGYGSEVLSLLKERYKGRKLFLARERLDEPCDNLEQRKSRRSFYLSNGFTDQSGHIKEGKVTYDIMYIGEPVTAKEYDILIKNWAGRLIQTFVGLKIVD
ncbi:MAG: GNAT family N-acetyltransferase [Oscillospiraceae bacterium]